MVTENNIKYLKPPDISTINSVIKKFGVSEYQFERFFGIPKGTIKVVRTGDRVLPSKFWHLFYDPQYKSVLRRGREKEAVTKVVTNPINADKSKSSAPTDSRVSELLSK